MKVKKSLPKVTEPDRIVPYDRSRSVRKKKEVAELVVAQDTSLHKWYPYL